MKAYKGYLDLPQVILDKSQMNDLIKCMGMDSTIIDPQLRANLKRGHQGIAIMLNNLEHVYELKISDGLLSFLTLQGGIGTPAKAVMWAYTLAYGSKLCGGTKRLNLQDFCGVKMFGAGLLSYRMRVTLLYRRYGLIRKVTSWGWNATTA